VGAGHLTGLDPTIKAVLDLEPASAAALWERPVEELRAEADEATAVLSGPGEAVERAEELELGGVPVRLYSPVRERPLPVVAFCHGGGWVAGSLHSYDPFCRRLANASGLAVVSVGYRLAPEHTFPAQLEDVEAVLGALEARGAALGLNPAAIAVAGDSAGGHLAALAARRSPARVRLQALVYPALDPACATASHRELSDGYGLSAAEMGWYWRTYLGGRELPGEAGLASAPPAYVLTAEYDPLRDEAEAYAARLRAAGVSVQVRRWPGTAHGFARWLALTPLAAEAVGELADALRAALVD
jgi:acetyl esterase